MPTNPATWTQLPQPTSHATGFVAAGPLVVITRGLPEYEAIERRSGGLDVALTLLRCVGWLARTDLATRREDAGPAIEVPDAQCRGTHVFEYAVSLDGAADDAALVRASADYRQPVRVGPAAIALRGALEIDGSVAFSALKRSEDGEGVIARLYAPGASELPFTVRSRGRVRRVRLDESPADDPRVPRTIGAGEIVTLRIEAPSEAAEA
jgi:alpha-mannosidase